MSFQLVGKTSPYTGYLLFEILNNLKNYGKGRVVIRNSMKKFPEMSFYIIQKVIPLRETIGPGPDELVYGHVWVDETYRGRKMGTNLLKKITCIPDWALIPREEEEKYLKFESKEIVKILPKYDTLPPVIADLAKKNNPTLEDEPKIELVYQDLDRYLTYKIAEEGMTPDHRLKVKIPEKYLVGIKR